MLSILKLVPGILVVEITGTRVCCTLGITNGSLSMSFIFFMAQESLERRLPWFLL